MAADCGCEAISERIELLEVKNGLESVNNREERCYKCGRTAEVRGREKSCKECFLQVFSKNFRSNLRTKCLEPKESSRKLGIVCSEGFMPVLLLHLMLKRNQDRHMKLRGRESEGNPDEKDYTFKRITESDDLKLKLVIKIKNPVEEGDFEYTSKGFLKSVLSTFEKFTKNYKISNILESESLSECEVEDLKVATVKICYFLHFKERLKERKYEEEEGEENNQDSVYPGIEDVSSNMNLQCTKECEEFEGNLRKLMEEDEDCVRHIWRVVRMVNLKKYIEGNGGICTHILSQETQEEICKEAFFLTCIGLGSEVSHRTSFVDRVSLKGCSILRPLKTFSIKELEYYHRFNELGELPRKSEKIGRNSIMGCIEEFSEELSNQHSNSFHNMTNITNRLVERPLELQNKNKKRCKICEAVSSRSEEPSLNLINVESEEDCKGCSYFRINNSKMLEYFERVFANN